MADFVQDPAFQMPGNFNLQSYEEKWGPKQDLIDKAKAEAEAQGLKYIGDASTWERLKEGIKQSPDLVANYALGSAAGISELLVGLGLATWKGAQMATTTDPERLEKLSKEPAFTKYLGKIEEAAPTVDLVKQKLSGLDAGEMFKKLGYYTGPPTAAFALPGKIAGAAKALKPEALAVKKVTKDKIPGTWKKETFQKKEKQYQKSVAEVYKKDPEIISFLDEYGKIAPLYDKVSSGKSHILNLYKKEGGDFNAFLKKFANLYNRQDRNLNKYLKENIDVNRFKSYITKADLKGYIATTATPKNAAKAVIEKKINQWIKNFKSRNKSMPTGKEFTAAEFYEHLVKLDDPTLKSYFGTITDPALAVKSIITTLNKEGKLKGKFGLHPGGGSQLIPGEFASDIAATFNTLSKPTQLKSFSFLDEVASLAPKGFGENTRKILQSHLYRMVRAAKVKGIQSGTSLAKTEEEFLKILSEVDQKKLSELLTKRLQLQRKAAEIKKDRLGPVKLDDIIDLSHMEAVADNWRATFDVNNLFFAFKDKNRILQRNLNSKIKKALNDFKGAETFSAKKEIVKKMKDIEQQLIDNNLISKIGDRFFGASIKTDTATEIIKKTQEAVDMSRYMKDGGEVKKFAAGGPNFVADPAFDMPNEKFEMSDLTQFVPPHWRQAGQDIKQGLGYLKEKFVDRPMELDYAQKETKTETLLNTIEQMGYDISPFYGVLRAGKMFNEDTARALEEYMTGEYGEMGKSVLMAAMATLGMIPVVGTEARVVRGAIGQTKKAIRSKVGSTAKITSKEDVIEPGLVEEPGSVVMQDGKPMVVDADGNYKPMPVFESKLEKSLNLTDAPQSATTEQWLEYFRKNGVNERELAEAGILDELNRAKTFERSTPNEQLKTMYEESSARNLNIIEKTEGGRGDNKARHKHAGSDETGFDQAGENYHEVVFQSGTVKGDPDAFVQGSHYEEPNVLAFTRNKDYTTTDNMKVTAIQEWQTDLGAQAFDQQKKLKEILEGLRGQELIDAPKTVYRPFPVPEAGLKILIDEINAIDGELAALMPQKVAPAVDVAPGAVISKMYGTETRGVPPIFKMEPENTPKMLELMKRQQNVIDEMLKMDTVQNYLKQMKDMGVETTFPNVPFKNELDLMRLTIKANARMAAENGQQGLVIANSDIVNGRWNKKLVKRQYDVEGQLFDTKEEAIAWKDANNPQAKVKTVIDDKSTGYKFFQIYDQKIPQVMNEIAKEMGTTVVMKEIAVGTNTKPFVIKNKQGDVVDSFRTMEEAKQAYPQAKSQPEIWAAEEFAGTPPAAGHQRLPAEITNFFIDVERMKTQQVFMLELNDNFLYPQAIYKRHGGLVESSLKSINDIMRPL